MIGTLMFNIRYAGRTQYNVNSLCYRAPEFDTVDWSNSFVIQGCSQVFGESTMDDTQIVNHYLSVLLNSPVINLGVPGSGMEVQYVNALEMLENGIKPKGVFIIYPNMDRYSLYANNQREHVGSWSSNEKLKWMLNGNSRTQNINLMRGYRLLWKFAGVPLYEWSHQHDNKDFCEEVIQWDQFLDFGPDNQHWGPKTSQAIAEILFNQFKKQVSKTTD
jgi:hypothetical protein